MGTQRKVIDAVIKEMAIDQPTKVTDQRIRFEKTIEVDTSEAAEMQGILDWEEGNHPNHKSGEVIKTYSIEFNTEYGRFGCDIKVCNANTPYVDAVLFGIVHLDGKNIWEEICVAEISEAFLGETYFEIEEGDINIEFVIDVAVKPQE